ncbi:hypothetical protein CJ030_MR2G023336 [Morella rubra]|uniref:Uncharacterized protein n=1 Tax=Morella rubra TaxID=262757 RepID=A0A6A1WJ63_9ROSI|nr:hypothetical protein CJ030_MR2G023336 [Morella rubra]
MFELEYDRPVDRAKVKPKESGGPQAKWIPIPQKHVSHKLITIRREHVSFTQIPSLIETRALGGLNAFESLYRNLIGIRMDIQARIGSVTSRIFCSRKHKSQSSSYSSSKPYSPLRLFCSRRNYQEPRENDNNDNKGDKSSTDWDKAWSNFRKQGRKTLFSQFSPDKYVSWNPRRSNFPLSEEVDPIKRTERSNLMLWTSPKVYSSRGHCNSHLPFGLHHSCTTQVIFIACIRFPAFKACLSARTMVDVHIRKRGS